jgi:hypothetical protein
MFERYDQRRNKPVDKLWFPLSSSCRHLIEEAADFPLIDHSKKDNIMDLMSRSCSSSLKDAARACEGARAARCAARESYKSAC